MSIEIISTLLFLVFITAVLLVDLLLVGRKTHVISMREATIWSVIWISMGLAFYFVILHFGHMLHGIDSMDKLNEIVGKYNPYLQFKTSTFETMLKEYKQSQAINYISGYFIEKTLSIDNIFVMLMILQSFSVPQKDYKMVLFWGILGAIVLRFVFIFAGVAIIQQFEWILLVFGAFLVFQGFKIFFEKDGHEKDPHDSWLFKYLSRHIKIHHNYEKEKFWFRDQGKLIFTPLFVVLIMIEFSDVIFAFDSIPAIFAVSRDPFIVFFSNIFAILGLRSLFFLIANLVNKFRYLKPGIAVLLIFVGIKLLLHSKLRSWGFQPEYSLYFIAFVMTASIVLSIIFPKKGPANEPLP
ncbi:TerC/Alx family metal homeostasis membrane protein [Maribellus maritimus]|uniref:TerC/Alx family metal homeostasis membrane protein n=1 Tax=Maribellus maritimus TaxID=2870838 RepID=UPI001EEA0897|nr:TerC/Alx family metal homeostasis membrane protein [Maribellus maritimus]MCG6190989.1 TerC/Alx family metal homeostasis membrane protein [Maribellus maritimus]